MIQGNVGRRPLFGVVGLLAALLAVRTLAAQAAGTPPTGLLPAVFGQETAGPTLSSFLTGTNFTGLIQTSYTYNFHPSKGAGIGAIENPGRVFDTRHNEFMLNQVLIDMYRPTDKDHLVGFQITPLIGDDATQVHAASPAGNVFFGSDATLINAAILLRVPDEVALVGATEFKIGHWVTTHGGEVIPATGNWLFSRSYLFGFAIPFTHTGVMATTPWATREDGGTMIATELGWVNGWDSINDNNDSGSLMAGFYINPTDWLSTGFKGMWGPEQPAGNVHPNGDYRTLLDFVAQFGLPKEMYEGQEGMDFLGGLKLLLNLDWAGEEGVDGVGYSTWYGLAGTVRFDFSLGGDTKDWFVAFRGEYFDDEDGTRLNLAALGARMDVYEFTGSLGYYPVQNVLVRTEVRYDKANTAFFEVGPTGAATKNHQVTWSFDTVLTF